MVQILVHLIDALDGIPGIERIRYMTSHPQDMSKSMIDALGRSSNIVTHFTFYLFNLVPIVF